jgi:hypothetical protein
VALVGNGKHLTAEEDPIELSRAPAPTPANSADTGKVNLTARF